MSQSKYWIGTIFLEQFGNRDKLEEDFQRLGAEYVVYQLECGHETANAHWQLYVVLRRRGRVSTFTRIWPRTHWELRRGTHEECRNYCSKDDGTRIDGPWTWGVEPASPEPGRRSDILALREGIAAGKSDVELWRDSDTFAPMLRYARSVPIARSALCGSTSRTMPQVFILWGPPGTGKSARCEAFAKELQEATYRVSSPMGRTMPVWWDGYIGQKFIIFDDFYGWVQFTKILKLCDRYTERVDYRGGSCDFQGEIICFTSNTSPDQWWKTISTDRFSAFERRISISYEVKTLDQVCPPFPSLCFDDDDENTQSDKEN